MKAKVLIKADSRFPINRKRARQVVNSVLKENGVRGEVEVSILVAGDRKMKALNQKYRRRKEMASVLSFSMENTSEDSGLGFADSPDGALRLGDIVISYPQALKVAAEENILVDDQIEKLIRHGMKHLLGIK